MDINGRFSKASVEKALQKRMSECSRAFKQITGNEIRYPGNGTSQTLPESWRFDKQVRTPTAKEIADAGVYFGEYRACHDLLTAMFS